MKVDNIEISAMTVKNSTIRIILLALYKNAMTLLLIILKINI